MSVVALFLDELNRARPEILQTVMDLALNRKLIFTACATFAQNSDKVY